LEWSLALGFHLQTYKGHTFIGVVLLWGLDTEVKVSATLQDCLRADRSSFVVLMKNSLNYTFFGGLIIPENDFLFKKRQKFSMFGKWEGFFTRTCLHR